MDSINTCATVTQPKTSVALALPGGGVRGVMQMIFLNKISTALNATVPEIFPNVAATSVGTTTAAVLYTPGQDGKPKFTPAEGLALYPQMVTSIFERSLLRRALHPLPIFNARYSRSGLESVMTANIGDARLRDSLGNDFVMTTFDCLRQRMHTFSSAECRDPDHHLYDLRVTTGVYASTAAPTYFGAFDTVVGGRKYSCIDGGMGANDPSNYALNSALKQSSETCLVVLGTGIVTPAGYEA